MRRNGIVCRGAKEGELVGVRGGRWCRRAGPRLSRLWPPRRAAPDCDTTANSQILRTGKPITLSVNCFDADGDTVTRQPRQPRPRHAGRVRPQRADAGASRRPSRPPAPTPARTTSTSPPMRRELELADVRLRPDHHREPRAPVRANGTFHAKVDQTIQIGLFCSDEDTQDQQLTYTATSRPGARHARQRPGLQRRLHAGQRLHRRGQLHGPRLRRRPGRHLLPARPRRRHAAVLDAAGGRRSAPARAATSPSSARGPTTTSARTATRSSRRRPRARSRPSGIRVHPERTYTADAGASGADSFTEPRHRRERREPGRHPGDHDRPQRSTPRPICDADPSGPQVVYAGPARAALAQLHRPRRRPADLSAGAAPEHGTSATTDGRRHLHRGSRLPRQRRSRSPSPTATAARPPARCRSTSTPPRRRAASRARSPSACGPASASTSSSRASTRRATRRPTPTALPPRAASAAFDDTGAVTYTAERRRQRHRHVHAEREQRRRRQRPAAGHGHDRRELQPRAELQRQHVQPEAGGRRARPRTLDLGAFCTDPDGDPLVVRAPEQPAHGSVTSGPAATLSYTPAGGYIGPDAFSFVARDDRGAQSRGRPPSTSRSSPASRPPARRTRRSRCAPARRRASASTAATRTASRSPTGSSRRRAAR